MEVKLDKQYPLDVDADRAWALLSDLKATAGCMPGAEILEQLSDTSYKGAVKVKVGPAVAQFGGTVDVVETNTENRTVVLRGKGADKGGSFNTTPEGKCLSRIWSLSFSSLPSIPGIFMDLSPNTRGGFRSFFSSKSL